jgi:hypothetical protein
MSRFASRTWATWAQREGLGAIEMNAMAVVGKRVQTLAVNAWKSAATLAGVDVVAAGVHHDQGRLMGRQDPIGVAHRVLDLRPAESAVDHLMGREVLGQVVPHADAGAADEHHPGPRALGQPTVHRFEVADLPLERAGRPGLTRVGRGGPRHARRREQRGEQPETSAEAPTHVGHVTASGCGVGEASATVAVP